MVAGGETEPELQQLRLAGAAEAQLLPQEHTTQLHFSLLSGSVNLLQKIIQIVLSFVLS